LSRAAPVHPGRSLRNPQISLNHRAVDADTDRVRATRGPAAGQSGELDAAERAGLGADALLNAIFDQSEVGMTVVDRELRFVRVNALFGILRGRKPAGLVGQTIAEAVPEVAAQVVPATLQVLATGKPLVHEEVRVNDLHEAGDTRAYRTIRYPVIAPGGEVVGVTSIVIDITDLRKAQVELDTALVLRRERDAAELVAKRSQVETLARYRMIFEGASVGILRVDPAGHVVEANPAMERMLGYSAAELAEMSFRHYTHPDDIEHNLVLFNELIQGKRDTYQLEKRCFHKNGKLLWTQVTASLERDADGSPAFAISMFEDITERKLSSEILREQAERNEHQALHDALTGLANRRKLYLDVEARLAAASPFVLAIFDLDGFKAYNDTFGHPAGDALLARLGGRLGEVTAEDGAAYRMGGDEFCVVGELRDADAMIERAREALCEQGEAFTIGCSVGAAQVPDEASTLEQALRLGDERLYSNKRTTKVGESFQVRDALLQLVVEQNAELATHATSVADLAAATAARLGLPAEEIARTRIAAELHDIGKTAIPASILEKPGPLDAGEWEFIKRHTLIGERIVAAAPALAHIAPVVRSSHERQDGRGYPDGLRADAIPLGARIVAVVDAFDAMVTRRPYMPAVSTAEALVELHRCAGSQFDPAVVAAFASVLERPQSDARAA
jgi:PAS domain S-box-containing protein/diguanylate cyclase (GGDEF)-like protein